MDYSQFIPGAYALTRDGLTEAEIEKIPQSIDAEIALLGTVLSDNVAVYAEIRDLVKPEDFFDPVHTRIAERVFSLSRRGELADAVVIKKRFERDESLDEIGGVEFITFLLSNATTVRTASAYATMIAGFAARRKVIGLATAALREAQDPASDLDAEDLIIEILNEISGLQGTLPASATFTSLTDVAIQAVEDIGKDRPMGLPSGYSDLDDKLAGLGRGKLITIAGRPSMGKTCLATNIARNLATSIGEAPDGSAIKGKVGFFSQEMPASELGERSASAALGPSQEVEYRDITAHKVTPSKKAALLEAARRVPGVMVDETAGLTFSDIEKRARALEKQLGGLDCLVVDYLQLMEGTDAPDPRNDVKYYGWIANNFKTLAKKMDIVVIMLSQLSRKVEDRENQRPRKSDLKGSGTIEDASDVIIFVFRPEVPLIEKGEPVRSDQRDKYYADLNWAKGRLEAIIGKNKGGPLGTVSLRAFMGYDVITEYADEDGSGFDEDIPF